jgi:uncharacterized membrane protein (DUF485 family)
MLRYYRSLADPSYLLTWLFLSSFHPLLFILTILAAVLRGDMAGVASTMVHSGLAFLITMFCMHLLYTLYRQIKANQEYERMNSEENSCVKHYNAIV